MWQILHATIVELVLGCSSLTAEEVIRIVNSTSIYATQLVAKIIIESVQLL